MDFIVIDWPSMKILIFPVYLTQKSHYDIKQDLLGQVSGTAVLDTPAKI